ncbi:hypothetical protein V866_008637 [Kwoniella sp. B9012]
MSDRDANQRYSQYYTSGAGDRSLGTFTEGQTANHQSGQGDGTGAEDITTFLEQYKNTNPSAISNAPFSAEHRRGEAGSDYDGSSVPHTDTGPKSIYDFPSGHQGQPYGYSAFATASGVRAGSVAAPPRDQEMHTNYGVPPRFYQETDDKPDITFTSRHDGDDHTSYIRGGFEKEQR